MPVLPQRLPSQAPESSWVQGQLSALSLFSLLQTVPRPAWAAWGQGLAAVRSVALATSRWAPSVSVSLLPMGHRYLGVSCHHELRGPGIGTG